MFERGAGFGPSAFTWRSRSVCRPPPFREQALCHELAGTDDNLQPIADLGRAANGIDDLTRDPVPPNQVAARGLCSQGSIVGRHRDNLGGLSAKTFFDKLRR